MKSAFLLSKGLLCLYDKQNNTWLLVDMEFLFSCSTQHLLRSLRSLVSYRVKHWKRNSISTRAHVLFSLYHVNCGVIQGFPALRKAETTNVKKYHIFPRVLTRHSFGATGPGWWMNGKAFTILNTSCFLGLSRIMAAKTPKNPYRW